MSKMVSEAAVNDALTEPTAVRALNDRVPELMGVKEVAAELGVEMGNLDAVAGLPEEAQTLSRGRIWRGDVIRRFAKARKERARG